MKNIFRTILILSSGIFINYSISSSAIASPSGFTFANSCQETTVDSNRVFIRDNSVQSVYEFLDAARIGGQTICLLDVSLDLTKVDTSYPIPISGGTKILGTRSPNNTGSALFVTKNDFGYFNTDTERNLFELTGNGITINGVGIIGADFSGDNETKTRGIMINSKVDIEIANTEIAGWGIVGIQIRDDENLIKKDDYLKINIHDSYIHHNQNGNLGYGVAVSGTAYALIKNNVFDFNRHAIASDGKNEVGYFALQNLVLKGGGEHANEGEICKFGICIPYDGPNSHTHQFDMHSDSGGDHKGGHAGEYVELGENTMQYDKGNGYYLRGTPTIKTYAYNNFFAQPRFAGGDILDGAFATYSTLLTNDSYTDTINSVNNTIKYDTYGKYKVCDIDGDGKDDLIQPAGATWWYSSQGKYPWTFLESSYTQWDDLLTFTDFDNDGACDIVKLEPYTPAIELAANASFAYKPVIYNPIKKTKIDLGNVYFYDKNIRIGDFDGDGYKDFFTAANNTWSMYSTRTKTWTVLNTSVYPVKKLAFGDFNGDKKTDVLGISDTQNSWVVSWSGTSTWEKINNKLSSDIESFYITDMNEDGKDDVVLVKVEPKIRFNSNPLGGATTSIEGYDITTYISRSGSEYWLKKSHYIPHKTGWEGEQSLNYFVGNFNGIAGTDLLITDTLRNGFLSSGLLHSLEKYSLFNY